MSGIGRAAFLVGLVAGSNLCPARHASGEQPRAAEGAGARAGRALTTLARVKAAGTLACGSNIEQPEFSIADAHGNHAAFDVDLCQAVATAVLGKGAKLTVVPYRAEKDALAALESGKIVLLATGSANLVNRARSGLGFSRPVLYDYQGFMVRKNSGVASARDLAGKKICALGGTEIEEQLAAFMGRQGISYLPFPFSEEGEMEAAFVTGNCAAITADVTQLAYERIAFKQLAASFVILPDVVAKDPLAVAYRRGDPQWAAIIDWVVEALIQAEESQITQANLAAMRQNGDPVVRRLLGTQRGYGQYLGLRDGWAAEVIEAVGNYGEIFARDLGPRSPLHLDRGPNELWTHGGLMVALPMR